jgi:hypothetical protein
MRLCSVEVYCKKTGNVLRVRSGFKSIEAAMDWGEKILAEFGEGVSYRIV